MSGYRLSPAAESDLSGIWDYTAQQWDVAQAERYILAIRDRLDGLASGRIPARDAGEIRRGYLKCAAGSHMLYFTREPDGTLHVIRILHQAMDVQGPFEDHP
ncbi:type II toxin-antitoxin system RelE/ParE family toxin [Devosia sp.]|uniref:type II toxin-antitoxin system RelE/ParE family toxin n=1 Tax=Devosia sp. TaxID=1871048 RepID=UPI003BAB46C7